MMLGVVALVWLWGFGEFWFAGFGRYFSTPGRSLRGSLPTSPSWIYARPGRTPKLGHGTAMDSPMDATAAPCQGL